MRHYLWVDIPELPYSENKVRLEDALFTRGGDKYSIEVFRVHDGYRFTGSIRPSPSFIGDAMFWRAWFLTEVSAVPRCTLRPCERRELLFEELLKNTILSKYRNSDDPAFKTFIRTACCDAVIADSFFRYQ